VHQRARKQNSGFCTRGVGHRPPFAHRRRAPPWATSLIPFACLVLSRSESVRAGKIIGACMDTGATRSVIGRRQATAYATLVGTPARESPEQAPAYRFGGVLTPCSGMIDIRVPVGTSYFVALRVAVVELDVPILFGTDALDALSLYVNNVENALKCDYREIVLPLVRKDGHMYLEWTH